MNTVHMAVIGALGAAFAFTPASNAAPLGAAGPSVGRLGAEQSNIIEVQRGVYRGGRTIYASPRIVTRGGYGYWGPHRGYSYARPGYRYYDGWWFPPAAFAAGALIGGAIATQAAPVYADPAPAYGGVRLSPEHYAWCQQRYISYRAYDNSFQPYEGPRLACVSPYS